MAQFPNILNCDLHSGPVSASIRQMYLGDIEANRVGVRVTDNGEAVALSGTCSGTAMLYNGGTVALTGVVDGNVAYVDLPAAVYSVEGPLKIFVTLTQGGSTTTLLEMRSNVTRKETGVVIDPGTIIPSVAALISNIEDAVASIPEDYSELSADVVQLKADMEDVQPAVETLEDDVSDLKSQINGLPKVVETVEDTADFYLSDARGNVLAQFSGGHIRTKNFDSSETHEQGFEWKFSGNDLLLGYGYNDTIDAVVVLNEGRANGLFDFAKLCSKPKETPLEDLETADLTVIWNSGTDMHGPFQFLAVNNADGYHADATDPGFTGGNHTLNDRGSNWKTASSKGVRYFADGHQVLSGSGRCNHFEMRWANGVQAYNTAVEGGTGRECLIEYHDMIFDGIRFNEQIRLVPSEDIKMQLWYGLQFVGFSSIYPNICFRDATNRQIYANPDSTVKSGNAVTSAMLACGTNDAIELTVDTTVDLGTRNGFYTGDSGAFASPSIHKGYFNIINKSAKVDMPANTTWYLKGSFRFFAA